MSSDPKGLIGQLESVRKHFGGAALKLCYEALYVGFSLQHDLQDRGYACEVVSPSSIPRCAGKAVKTDRIDAAEPAEFYANGLLTVVLPPDAEVEQDRDLLRSRQRLIQHLLIRKKGRSEAAHSVTAAAQRVALQGRVPQQDALADASLFLPFGAG